MFRITGGQGFQLTVNDVVISVQFGPYNYCDNYGMDYDEFDPKSFNPKSFTAEIALFTKSGAWRTRELTCMGELHDDVIPRCTMEDFLKILDEVRSWE